MIGRLLSTGGERFVYGLVVGFGTALLYAAALAATGGSQTMLVGLLVLGVCGAVLFATVMRIAHPAPQDDTPLPPSIERSMARERPRPSRRSRPPVLPAHREQLPMPLPARHAPVGDPNSTTVVLDLDPATAVIPATDATAEIHLPHGGVRRG